MSDRPKIAILYIALGRYITFWDDFYKSSEKYFVEDASKSYFVFTDCEKFKYSDCDNVHVIKQEKLGWPYDTLMRFKMFLSIEEQLKDFDYIFFFNANMKFISPVGHEILPTDLNDGLVVGLHPSFDKKAVDDFSYDRNPESSAYIPYGEGMHYVQGCINGGKRDAYLKLCFECNKNVENDIEKNVVALWHDESHLNKYLIDKNPLILTDEYLYPEAGHAFWHFNRSIKIVQRDKTQLKYGGYDYLRGASSKKMLLSEYLCKKSYLCRFFKKMINK